MGFVSNSSSSSFCILGVAIDRSKLKIDGKTLEELEEACDDGTFDDYQTIDEFKPAGLDVFFGYEGDEDTVYIGQKPEDFKDDETIGQMKSRISDTLKKFDIPIGKQKVRFIEDSCGNC